MARPAHEIQNEIDMARATLTFLEVGIRSSGNGKAPDGRIKRERELLKRLMDELKEARK